MERAKMKSLSFRWFGLLCCVAAVGEEIKTEGWPPPRFEERREERCLLVNKVIVPNRPKVKNVRVLDALRNVPRHRFVPKGLSDQAYDDNPLPIGHGQTISQPYVVAYMTDLLEVSGGDKVLEIGTGSGYQAAVLAEITPHVFSMEIVKPLAEAASERLQSLGYKTVRVRQGDGYDGWPKEAPFDRIIVTAAAGHVPPPLLRQLKVGGKLVIPVGGRFSVQRIVRVTKEEDGRPKTESLLPVRFVPLTGKVERMD